MPWRKPLYPRLLPELAAALRMLDARDAARLQEIRIYADRPAVLVFEGRTCGCDVSVGRAQMDNLLSALCGHALYSCESQLAEGYIPLPGGHRAGVCGRMTRGQDDVWRMGEVSSVCIRICRSIPGASARVRPYLLDAYGLQRRVLLLGAPGCGKTTVLRDAALYLSEELGLRVAVADEREELFASASAGERSLDVLAGTDKARAFAMLLRAMVPQVIVTDEIGREEDADALLDAVRCGVGVVASAHAGSMEDARRRPVLGRLVEARAFDRYILLGHHGSVLAVSDETGRAISGEENERGQLGCGRDGDDRHQRDRLFALGR